MCNRIKERRVAAGLTIEDLARLSKLTPLKLAAIERSTSALDPASLSAIAAALDCAPGQLFFACVLVDRPGCLELAALTRLRALDGDRRARTVAALIAMMAVPLSPAPATIGAKMAPTTHSAPLKRAIE